MKIRIKGNSVRLRLTRSEVAKFDQDGVVSEMTNFPGSGLQYVLKKSDQKQLTVEFDKSMITVLMPSVWANEWIQTERVGYEQYMDLEDNTQLYILVEKDFVCLDETNEDQSDNYPNPLASSHK